jgi:hypothetical protein
MSPVDYSALTERINFICYKLEHYSFASAEDREKLLKELKEVVALRNKLAETLDK